MREGSTDDSGWELLFYINAWLLSLSDFDAVARSIYATQYPYYLNKQQNASGVLQFDRNEGTIRFLAFVPDGKKQHHVDFLKDLAAVYEDINTAAKLVAPNFRGIKGIKAQFDEWFKKLPERPKPDSKDKSKDRPERNWDYNVLAWINHQVESAWPSLSRMYGPADQQKCETEYITVGSRNGIADGTAKGDSFVTPQFPSREQIYQRPTVLPARNAMAATDPLNINPGPAPLYPNIDDSLLGKLKVEQVMPEMTKGSTPKPTKKSCSGLTAWGSEYYIVCSKIESTDHNVL